MKRTKPAKLPAATADQITTLNADVFAATSALWVLNKAMPGTEPGMFHAALGLVTNRLDELSVRLSELTAALTAGKVAS